MSLINDVTASRNAPLDPVGVPLGCCVIWIKALGIMESVLCVCVCVFGTGEHLRVCSQEYTCCGVEMEDALTHRGKADLERLMEESSSTLRTVFTTKHRKFDGETQEVMF